jgi:hypothetical protein
MISGINREIVGRFEESEDLEIALGKYIQKKCRAAPCTFEILALSSIS